MCGILGAVSHQSQSVGLSDRQLTKMRDVMTARGPDAAGLFRRRNVAFAHRRLAIRDLRGGAQPLVSADGQTVLVYNGELYNDLVLRRELSDAGYQFRDDCDTEVVLAAYRHWGADSVSRLRGMFAFGIFDFRDQSLFLARDRFGIKPLFLSEVQDELLFASSIAAILADPRRDKQPNLAVLSHYLSTLRLTLGRETVYEGIWQLLPGEMLQWKDGQSTVSRYWEYPSEEAEVLAVDQATEVLEDRLSDAVSTRLVSDVPVGMFLSGGIDSSVLACLLRRHEARPLRAACGGGQHDTDQDDFFFARSCAVFTGMDLDEVRVGSDQYHNAWLSLIERQRTPLSTPSDVILYELSRAMKRRVGVVLGGEGADELLCGYAVQHWSGRDLELSDHLHGGTWRFGSVAAEKFTHGMQSQYGRDAFASETDHYFALNSLIPPTVKDRLWQPWAWQRREQDRRMWSYYGRLFDQLEALSAVEKTARILHAVNLESLLARLDSASMQASLEARVPYADHLLVEQMFRLPHRFKIDVAEDEAQSFLPSAQLQQRGTLRSKRILRQLAGRLLPAELANRQKASFPTPVQGWLQEPWRMWAAQQIRHSPFAQAVFEPRTLDELFSNPAAAGMWLWPLLNISLWGDQEFVEQSMHAAA